MHPDVTTFLDRATQWQAEMKALRSLLLGTALQEAYKWQSPCYTFAGRNVVMIGSFKAHCVLSFFEGARLTDPKGLLQLPGPNTQSGRILVFQEIEEVAQLAPDILAFVKEAMALPPVKEAAKPSPEPSDWPAELSAIVAQRPEVGQAFTALSAGRQRGYLLHFQAAKQSQTRTNRILKSLPRILEGKGMQDCVCGLSRKMPQCDGSHQQLKK